MATRRAANGPADPATPMLVMAGGAVATVAAVWPGYLPFGAVGLAAVMIAAVMAPGPVLTGKKDSSGRPTAASAAEEAQVRQFGVWQTLRGSLLLPGAHWLPGKHVRFAWLYALAAALGSLGAPLRVEVLTAVPAAPWIGAVATFMVVTAVDAAWRTARTPADPCKGVGLFDVAGSATKPWLARVAAAVVAAVVAAAAATGLAWVPDPTTPVETVLPMSAVAVAAGWAAWMAVLHLAARTRALDAWRDQMNSRAMWSVRWAQSKQFAVTPPALVSHERVGPAAVDTFEVPVMMCGASTFVTTYAAAVSTLVGAGQTAVVLETPNIDPKTGQDVLGTQHPTRVKIATWPDGSMPSVTDPTADRATVELLLQCGISQAVMKFNPGWQRPLWMGATLVSTGAWAGTPDDDADGEDESSESATEPAPNVWAIQLEPTPQSVDWLYLGRELFPFLCEAYGTDVVVAKRAPQRIFVGPVDEVALDPALPRTAQYGNQPPRRYMDDIREEPAWNTRWGAVKGVGANIPTPQFMVRAQNRLASGAEVHYLPFVCRDGFGPETLKLFTADAEAQMSTGLGAAPFVSLQAYPQNPNMPNGERNTQAVVAVWSSSRVPLSPAALAPTSTRTSRDSAAYWVLRAMMDRAFDAAKLPRPEVVEAQALSTPTSPKHVWRLKARLYRTTLADARAAQTKIASALQVPWVRFAADSQEGFVTVFLGNPTEAEFAQPVQSHKLVASLNWEQAFAECGLMGADGRTPTMAGYSTMPRNKKVEVLDFALPTPLAIERIRMNDAKLRAASGNVFMDVRQGGEGAQSARITCCAVDPMPFPAPFDWDAIEAEVNAGSLVVPFATGVDGEPVVFDIKHNPHAMIVGTTGSGKSVAMQSFGFVAAAHGWDVWVIDPTKGAADFRFLESYAKAFAVDVHSAAAAMKLIEQELDERKRLNSEHGVGSYRDVPVDVRRPHVMVLVDEFTSLIAPEQVSTKPSDSLDIEMERAAAIHANESRARIAATVGRIAREARSAGITLVLGTQKLAAKDLDTLPGGTTLKTNLARILMGNTSSGDRMSALRDPFDAPSLGEFIPQGRGLFEPVTSGIKIVQTWYDEGEQDALRERLFQMRPAVHASQQVDLSALVPAPRNIFTSHESAFFDDDDEDSVEDLGVVELDWSDVFGTDGTADQGDTAALQVALHEPAEGGAVEISEVATSDEPAGADLVVAGDGADAALLERPGALDVRALPRNEARLAAVVSALDGAKSVHWVDTFLDDIDPVFEVPWRDLAAEEFANAGVADVRLEVPVVAPPMANPAPSSPAASPPVRRLRPPAIPGLFDEGTSF